MTTKVLTAHVPLSSADKVDQLATRMGRLRAWIIKQALSAWIYAATSGAFPIYLQCETEY